MAQRHRILDLLDGVVSAPDERRVAEAALAGLQAVAPGEHFSAIRLELGQPAWDIFILGDGWLAEGNPFWQAARTKLLAHPLALKSQASHQPMALARSREVPDALWHRSMIYQEVDRALGLGDIATVCLIPAPRRRLLLTCGRGRRFTDRDLAPIYCLLRVLTALAPFRFGGATAPPPQVPLATRTEVPGLSAREREVLHWLRQSKCNAEIAAILGISHHTVRHHLEHIYAKLGVETRLAAANTQSG